MRPVELAKIRSDMIHMTRTGAENSGKTFTDPEEDWAPMLIGADRDGKVTVVGVDPSFLATDAGKDTLADEVLPTIIAERGFVALGMVISTWVSMYEPNEIRTWASGRPPLRPVDDPQRKEMLMVLGVDRYGDEAYGAQIVRYPQGPPTLEPWERLDGEGHFSGRMIDPLRRGLRPQG